MLNRRDFLTGACLAVLIASVPALARTHGAVKADDAIAVSSLSVGNFLANAFTGFTSPATSVFTSGGFKLLRQNPDAPSPFIATTVHTPRDVQVSTYTARGSIVLRLSGRTGQESCLYFDFNGAMTGGDARVGIKTGINSTLNYESMGGNTYAYYVNTNVAASPEGIAAGFTNTYASGDLFTFGVQGFTVFLQWNGIDLIRYTEWRLMNSGKCAVWTHDAGGARDITVHYPTQTTLFSDTATQTYDARDFGMRAVTAVTGTISAGSNQLVLASNVGFVAGDTVIVEIGGESGAGIRGTVGVGGQWPILSYADLATMNADTGKANGTFAYILTNNFVYSSTSGIWSRDTGGGGAYNQGYYSDLIVPLSLVATVTAVSGNGLTLTLNTTATVAATAANVWLDCKPSFFLLNQTAPSGATVAPCPVEPVTLSIPAGDWRLSGIVTQATAGPTGFAIPSSGFTVKGAGKTLTTLNSPKGITCGAINITAASISNVTIKDMKYVGNLADNGFMFRTTGNTFGGYPMGFYITTSGATSGQTLKNLDCVNCMGGATVIDASTNPVIDTCSSTMQNGQRQYMGWQIQINDATGGDIRDCVTTGAFLLKSFELFACNGASMTRCTGTNALMSFNSCTSCSTDTPTLTIGASSFFDTLSGGIDEPIISINGSAFGSGRFITVTNPRIIQSGYIDASNNSLKAIQVLQTTVTDVTITGAYPGGGGCSTSLGGLIQAPNYDAGSAEYGSLGIYSDSVRTIVSGIRVKGTAIGTPGHSGHFGNISLLGASSSVTNCVADVIQTGPTLSGNQTNAAYGGC